MDLVFLDTETTHLHDDRRAWEIAAVIRRAAPYAQPHVFHRFVAAADLDLPRASPDALKVGGYWDRHPQPYPPSTDQMFGATPPNVFSERTVLRELADAIPGAATIVGANPQFDASTLARRMAVYGIMKPWHFRLYDVETACAAIMGWPVPRSLRDSAAALGLSHAAGQAHTARGDADLVMRVYDAIMAAQPGRA
jgi:DNA polymerase III epsilon subunit-like protein